MEKFLLLIREDVKKESGLSEEEFNKNIETMTRWVENLAETGNYISGEPLKPEGKYVGNEHIISDGPFIEAKEAISGYVFIRAENIDQAASIAKTCPEVIDGRIVIEVRPIIEMEKNV
ncbi:YciI family protein [Dyadobacter sp. NIV53]|uniref:YciI family protein n=1 Tax=Dyadobacter sp. NIV53 TaxID=2861765 RepID=UPI001C876B15|nr:YciI family protein [Dyadobacter sp. NIV53]